MSSESAEQVRILTEEEFESYFMRSFLPQYYGVGEEDVMKIIASHYAQTEYIEALESRGIEVANENLKLKAALKEACMMISTQTPQGAAAYEKLSKGLRNHA